MSSVPISIHTRPSSIFTCNTPFFDPVALDVYDVYIVNNHGAELKAKAPPSIGYAMFRVEIVTDGISRHVAYISSFVIM